MDCAKTNARRYKETFKFLGFGATYTRGFTVALVFQIMAWRQTETYLLHGSTMAKSIDAFVLLGFSELKDGSMESQMQDMK